MSMYAVNSSVPKTLIKHLVRWAAENVFDEKAGKGRRSAKEILLDVIDTPISPELKPADSDGNIKQKTEDLIGPYELHDFFLYNFHRYGWAPKKIYFFAKRAFSGEYDDAEILKWLKKFFWRFFSQQFKRSCLPDGPKISMVSLSPRADWRMPSDAKAKLWMDELDKLS
jgi:NAD+ synthase (glutamine-hydrolysing)